MKEKRNIVMSYMDFSSYKTKFIPTSSVNIEGVFNLFLALNFIDPKDVMACNFNMTDRSRIL